MSPCAGRSTHFGARSERRLAAVVGGELHLSDIEGPPPRSHRSTQWNQSCRAARSRRSAVRLPLAEMRRGSSLSASLVSTFYPRIPGYSLRIEVKAPLAGAEDFLVTRNEVVTCKKAAAQYRPR